MKSELNYQLDKLWGLSTKWYENGQKKSEGNLLNGKQVGLWKEWYENGQKKTEGNYKVVEKKDGIWQYWHENGQKINECFYKNGKRDGPCRHWFENGKIQLEHTLRNDKENGLRTEWYRTGDKSHEVDYQNGRFMSALSWKPDGKKCPVTNLVKGNGLVVLYNEDGTESMRSTFKNGYGVKPTVAEANNTKDDKFKQMILEGIDKLSISKKPIGSKPAANKIEQDDDVNAKKTPPINSKVKEKENDHGTNCVCKECRAGKICKGGIFPNL